MLQMAGCLLSWLAYYVAYTLHCHVGLGNAAFMHDVHVSNCVVRQLAITLNSEC